jgi:hypothetical protein
MPWIVVSIGDRTITGNSHPQVGEGDALYRPKINKPSFIYEVQRIFPGLQPGFGRQAKCFPAVTIELGRFYDWEFRHFSRMAEAKWLGEWASLAGLGNEI